MIEYIGMIIGSLFMGKKAYVKSTQYGADESINKDIFYLMGFLFLSLLFMLPILIYKDVNMILLVIMAIMCATSIYTIWMYYEKHNIMFNKPHEQEYDERRTLINVVFATMMAIIIANFTILAIADDLKSIGGFWNKVKNVKSSSGMNNLFLILMTYILTSLSVTNIINYGQLYSLKKYKLILKEEYVNTMQEMKEKVDENSILVYIIKEDTENMTIKIYGESNLPMSIKKEYIIQVLLMEHNV